MKAAWGVEGRVEVVREVRVGVFVVEGCGQGVAVFGDCMGNGWLWGREVCGGVGGPFGEKVCSFVTRDTDMCSHPLGCDGKGCKAGRQLKPPYGAGWGNWGIEGRVEVLLVTEKKDGGGSGREVVVYEMEYRHEGVEFGLKAGPGR